MTSCGCRSAWSGAGLLLGFGAAALIVLGPPLLLAAGATLLVRAPRCVASCDLHAPRVEINDVAIGTSCRPTTGFTASRLVRLDRRGPVHHPRLGRADDRVVGLRPAGNRMHGRGVAMSAGHHRRGSASSRERWQ